MRERWSKLPRWAKWSIGIVGAILLLGVGGLIGSSNESKLKDEVSSLEASLSKAEDKAARAEGLRVVREAKSQASKIINGAKREVAVTEKQLNQVKGSLEGAKHKKDLSSFGEGIEKAEVDYASGTYEAPGGAGCYWATLNSANTRDIADNEVTVGAGSQQIVNINTPYFQSKDCGTWKRIG